MKKAWHSVKAAVGKLFGLQQATSVPADPPMPQSVLDKVSSLTPAERFRMWWFMGVKSWIKGRNGQGFRQPSFKLTQRNALKFPGARRGDKVRGEGEDAVPLNQMMRRYNKRYRTT